MEDQNNTEQTEWVPSPEEMLVRLNKVDPNYFDIRVVADQLKGDKIWISILTLPVSAILLVLFTLLGAFLFDRPFISFIVSAGLLLWIGKLFDHQHRTYEYAARQEVIRRIAETEEGFGLIPHFKNFLPNKYRHLWQSVRKGNYVYIEQYVSALVLLQHKLNPDKFTRIWYMTYPQTDPYNSETSEFN